MKKSLSIIIFILLNTVLKAQPVSTSDFAAETTRLNAMIAHVDTSKYDILTYNGMNKYVVSKIASYLAKDGDLSLYKNYALADISDGVLYFGKNIDLRAEANKNDRLKSILTTGIKAKGEDNFAELFSKGSFNADIGIDLKYTFLFNGSVWYDNNRQAQKANLLSSPPLTQQQKMAARRRIIFNRQMADLTDRINDFNTGTVGINPLAYADMRTKFIAENTENIFPDFSKKEAEEFDKDKDSHNLMHTHWISISAFAPLTNTKYSVADSLLGTFNEKKFQPWEGNLNYTNVWDSRKYGSLYVSVGLGAFLNNSVKNEDIDKVDVNKYKQLGGTDTITIAQLSSDKSYVGKYEDFFTGKLKGQVVYYHPGLDWIGISVSLEQLIGQYNPLTFQFGFPMVLEGKDEDSKVNIELQFKYFDITNTAKPDQSSNDKFTIGISLGLPFSSIIY